jgi:uncharacterized membrane protein YkoI
MLLLLLMISVAYADQSLVDDDKSKAGEGARKTVEGEALWIEEKINPATRWLEKLVRPVTGWVEDKIQNHDEIAPSSRPDWNTLQPGPAIPKEPRPDSPQPPDQPVISADEAIAVAVSAFPGEVLRVKYLPGDIPVYRVKLISKKGEIHILYVNAWTADIVN